MCKGPAQSAPTKRAWYQRSGLVHLTCLPFDRAFPEGAAWFQFKPVQKTVFGSTPGGHGASRLRLDSTSYSQLAVKRLISS